MSDLVYGAVEAVAFHNGTKVAVHLDEPWPANDAFVKARPDLFRADPEKVQSSEPKSTTPRRSRSAKK